MNKNNAETIVIERNFLRGKQNVRKINGEQILEKDFEKELSTTIFPNLHQEKPSFRQIISHNIRYKDERINNTMKTLDKYSSDAEYETLYLFLFGCEFKDGENKQELLIKLKQEYKFKDRLEKRQTKTAYEAALSLIDNNIEFLNKKKTSFNLNENFEADLERLNQIKYDITIVSSEITRLNIRKSLIEETEQELQKSLSNIDTRQLEIIYKQATSLTVGIQKTFEELVNFHNQMILEKTKFVVKELPNLNAKLYQKNNTLNELSSYKKLVTSYKSYSLIIISEKY